MIVYVALNCVLLHAHRHILIRSKALFKPSLRIQKARKPTLTNLQITSKSIFLFSTVLKTER